jgi:23S rRNA-/tRNA-specific pseudouridylate synthase
MSKKAAGSSRRRALAAERRKGSNNNNAIDTKEAEKQLQSIYGPDIHILQETDDLIVFSKPAGQVCYHNRKTSAGKVSASRKKKKSRGTSEDDNDDGSKIDISLEDAVLDLNFALSTLNPVARGIVHRLDRGTSGCICLAKTNEAHLKLVATFFLRRVKKKYLALVPLSSPAAAASAAASPLDKDKEGVIDEFVDGKPALSKFRVVSIHDGGDDGNQGEGGVALLEVETLTGRKHQVRVHCSTIGHPLFLDPVYSSYQPPIPTSRRKTRKETERKKRQKAENNNSGAEVSTQNDLPKAISDLAMTMIPGQEKFFLHAKSLCIPEFDVDVEAPLPKFWTETLDQL